MARTRHVKPEFFLSEELAQLGRSGRLFYIGLWTLCDRDGRVEVRPAKMKAQIFPYDVDFTPETVMRTIAALAALKKVTVYDVEGKLYLDCPSIPEHQWMHNSEKSKNLPAPSNGNILKPEEILQATPRSNGKSTVQEPLLSRTAPVPPPEPEGCAKKATTTESPQNELNLGDNQGGRSESTVEPRSIMDNGYLKSDNGNNKPPGASKGEAPEGSEVDKSKKKQPVLENYSEQFEECLWLKYPKTNASKKQTYRAWNRALRAGARPDEIAAGVDRYVRWLNGNAERRKFPKHPTTWLNNDCWLLDYGEEGIPESSPQQHDDTTPLDMPVDDQLAEYGDRWRSWHDALLTRYGAAVWRSWFSECKLVSWQLGRVEVQVKSRFNARWITEHYPEAEELLRLVCDQKGIVLHITAPQ